MTACRTNLSPIFGVYADRPDALDPARAAQRTSRPWIDVGDEGGERHRVWRITDAATRSSASRRARRRDRLHRRRPSSLRDRAHLPRPAPRRRRAPIRTRRTTSCSCTWRRWTTRAWSSCRRTASGAARCRRTGGRDPSVSTTPSTIAAGSTGSELFERLNARRRPRLRSAVRIAGARAVVSAAPARSGAARRGASRSRARGAPSRRHHPRRLRARPPPRHRLRTRAAPGRPAHLHARRRRGARRRPRRRQRSRFCCRARA